MPAAGILAKILRRLAKKELSVEGKKMLSTSLSPIKSMVQHAGVPEERRRALMHVLEAKPGQKMILSTPGKLRHVNPKELIETLSLVDRGNKEQIAKEIKRFALDEGLDKQETKQLLDRIKMYLK